jgi:hypothetical protein
LLAAINASGTVEYAIQNFTGGSIASEGILSTTALSGSSNSANTWYSTTARTNVPYKLVGLLVSTQTTAGTWATAPSTIQGYGIAQQGQTWIIAPFQGSTVNSTSGTSIDFTGIPSWAKRITLVFNQTSLSGSANILVQIGSGSFVTSSYASASIRSTTGATNASSSTSGFMLQTANAGEAICGTMNLMNIGSGINWISSHAIGNTASSIFGLHGGGASPTLSGVLDRVRITSSNGTDTFDAGSIGLFYE